MDWSDSCSLAVHQEVTHGASRSYSRRRAGRLGRELDHVDRIFDRAVTRDDNGNDRGIALQRGLDHVAAVDSRESKVGNDHVEPGFRDQLQRFAPAACRRNARLLAQKRRQHFKDAAIGRFVVDEENPFLHVYLSTVSRPFLRHLISCG